MDKENRPHFCDPHSENKGSDTTKTICRVYELLAAGGKYSAKEINQLCRTNDARKCVSDLIKKFNVPIMKQWHHDGYKLFWFDPNGPHQHDDGATLFPEEAAAQI